MKAIVWTRYGPPEGLQLQEVQKPVPADGEVLIRIHATTVTAGDCEMRRLQLPLGLSLPMRIYNGFGKPERIKILGQELAGEIEAVGATVTKFKAGDPVFGSPGLKLGAYAEYLCLPEESEGAVLAIKPANTSFAEAAAVPTGGMEALHFLRRANIQPGQQVLINGAGGSIGTFAVQIARHYGAEVTAVDSSDKLEMLRAIGAGRVIDYTQEDFTKRSEKYDVLFDVVGTGSYSRMIRSLSPHGTYLMVNPRLSGMLRGTWASRTGGRQVIFANAGRSPEDLVFLKELIEAGEIKVVVDRTYPLEQAAEAHRYVETGRKKGNVVLIVRTE